MTSSVVNFGCRLNAYESEVIKHNLLENGVENAIVFNTCAVTAEAERQARQAIRKARRENPDAKIIVTGCSAQIHADEYSAMTEVDMVIGNEEKINPATYSKLSGSAFMDNTTERVVVNDIMSVKETALHLVAGFEGHTRAFVQIQNGCNHRCTFCIIPYGRGNSRSVPLGEIVSQVQRLVANGYSEVVLTGVDITDYGKDLPGEPTLGDAVRRILNLVPDLKRLRLSSIDPVEVDNALFDVIAQEDRFMPHLHISLQAGDDMVLKRMKRRHLRHDVVNFTNKVREIRPDAVFGADIIAGFPTESDGMFANTLRLIEEINLIYLHVFPYSSRTGTPAARMPQIAKEVRKERAKILRLAGERNLEEFLRTRVNGVEEVLVESGSMGRTRQFAPVKVITATCDGVEENYAPIASGDIINIRITGSNDTQLIGKA
jgi:threonylcarbamoyladenosine tRNA methylthiotransferase MtaB